MQDEIEILCTWRAASNPPEINKSHMKRIILATQWSDGTKVTQEAYWMNTYPLTVEDEDILKDYGSYNSDDGVRYVTGFFEELQSLEGESYYKPVENVTPLYWMDFPAPPGEHHTSYRWQEGYADVGDDE